MRTLDYRFFFDENGHRVAVVPVFNDDMALEYEKENGEQFLRASYSGNMSFVGDTYDFIMEHSFETTFTLIMQHRDAAGVWSDVHVSEFNLTDCTVNVDDKRITVKPRTRDRYTEVLEGMEREYNLIELAPAITPVRFAKRPLLQLYIQGEDVLSCFHGGMWWEQQVTAEEDAQRIQDDFHFAKTNDLRQFVITNSTVTFGVYFGSFPNSDGTMYNESLTNGTGVTLNLTYSITGSGGNITATFTAELVRDADGYIAASFTISSNSLIDTSALEFDFDTSAVGTTHCKTTSRVIFSRILCDATRVQSQDTYPITEDDFSYDNRNYRRVAPWPLNTSDIIVSAETQATPTEYGLAPDGGYYVRPSDDAYPIARTTWNEASVWFAGTISDYGSVDFTLRTCYAIDAVLAAILHAIAPSVVHEGTTTYSEFLYAATNPITATDGHKLMMTPKSNILAGEDAQPAMKAPVTLRTVLNMLRDVYGCYWHIDEQNRFRIEHIKYYKNGGSYSVEPTVGIDLTWATETRNGKPWTFGVNEYTFDKVNMPERYQFSWMDDVSKPFEGVPIIINSRYVQRDKVESVTIGSFTSDLDYMLLSPEDISKDGFALLSCDVAGTGYTYVPFADIDGVRLQNAYLSMTYLQPTFLLYDMPAWSLNVNGTDTQADMIQRQKRQKITYPYRDGTPDFVQLVRTGLGVGNIIQLSFILSSRTANMTIAYDTTEQPS
jgi:hypothetical protein